jgi:carboxyl-terminal processing protease
LIVIAAITLIVGFIAGTRKDEIFAVVAPVIGMEASPEPSWSSLSEVYGALKNNYDGKLDDDKLVEGAKKGLVAAAGDPYTVYMDSEEAGKFEKSLSGDVGAGIGVEIGERNGLSTIVRVLKDNPAKAAGVLAGDVIKSVNGEDVAKLTTDEVASKVRGEAGTTVKLKVVRGGADKEFNIRRETIKNPSVELEFKDGVAILRVTRFDQKTGDLARTAAEDINKKGANKVILDLRGNGGGYVTAARDLLSLWLTDKLLFTEKANGDVVEEMRSSGKALLTGKKTIVLADSLSASASEIVVGALKDYKAATFVGEKTFGKGSVQSQVNVSGGLLKVTIGKWYTPKDLNIGKSGIKPDVEVVLTLDDINKSNDKQMVKALQLLK